MRSAVSSEVYRLISFETRYTTRSKKLRTEQRASLLFVSFLKLFDYNIVSHLSHLSPHLFEHLFEHLYRCDLDRLLTSSQANCRRKSTLHYLSSWAGNATLASNMLRLLESSPRPLRQSGNFKHSACLPNKRAESSLCREELYLPTKHSCFGTKFFSAAC